MVLREALTLLATRTVDDGTQTWTPATDLIPVLEAADIANQGAPLSSQGLLQQTVYVGPTFVCFIKPGGLIQWPPYLRVT